jgi:hypothetical protein
MQQAAGFTNRNAMATANTQFFSRINWGWIFAPGEGDQLCRTNRAAEAILVAGLLVDFDKIHGSSPQALIAAMTGCKTLDGAAAIYNRKKVL